MKGLAISAMVLGIIGVLIFWTGGIGFILSLLALIFGLITFFKRVKRRMAITGIVLGIVGIIFSSFVIYVALHPELMAQYLDKKEKEFEEKENFWNQYSEEVKESAAKNAHIPDVLIRFGKGVGGLGRYEDLVIKELKRHPKRYPTKIEEKNK